MVIKRILFFILFLPSLCLAATPYLAFSDIISGPDTGIGDSLGSGAIITVWGNNLGTSQGSSKVYFTDSASQKREAAHVYYWCNADGSSGGPSNLTKLGLQEIAFSLPDGAAGAGTISVAVGGVDSNTLAFTVQTGRLRFCDASTGSSGDGSYASPWKTNADTYTGMAAGDIVYFKTGTYNTAFGNTNTFDTAGKTNGSSGAPYAWVAYPGSVATFSPIGASNSIFRTYQAGDWNYFIFSKLTVSTTTLCWVGMGDPGAGWSDGCRLVGNKATGETTTAQNQASIISVVDNAKIFGCEITGANKQYSMDHVIYIAGCPSSGAEVAYNYLHDNVCATAPHIQWNHESSRCGEGSYVGINNSLHHNYLDGSSGTTERQFSAWESSYTAGDPIQPTIYVYDNVFVGGGYYADGQDYGAVNLWHPWVANIYNNTFYNFGANQGAAIVGGSSYYFTCSLPYTVKNNIFYANASATNYIWRASSGCYGIWTVEDNCYYGIGNGPAFDTNPINGNPLFTSTSDYGLQSGSPCRDAAENLSGVFTRDFAGTSRSAWDIGAFEYYTTPALQPPTLSNVTISGGSFR